MDSNQSLLNKFSLGNFSLDQRMDQKEDFLSSPDDLESNSRIDVKGIREAIARVEAEARATVASETRLKAEAQARAMAEARAQAEAEAAELAQRNCNWNRKRQKAAGQDYSLKSNRRPPALPGLLRMNRKHVIYKSVRKWKAVPAHNLSNVRR
jgi:CHASE3 domain sensor protein